MKTLRIVVLLAVTAMLVLPAAAQATYPDSCVKANLNKYDILQKVKCYWDLMTEVWKNDTVIGPESPDGGGV